MSSSELVKTFDDEKDTSTKCSMCAYTHAQTLIVLVSPMCMFIIALKSFDISR